MNMPTTYRQALASFGQERLAYTLTLRSAAQAPGLLTLSQSEAEELLDEVFDTLQAARRERGLRKVPWGVKYRILRMLRRLRDEGMLRRPLP